MFSKTNSIYMKLTLITIVENKEHSNTNDKMYCEVFSVHIFKFSMRRKTNKYCNTSYKNLLTNSYTPGPLSEQILSPKLDSTASKLMFNLNDRVFLIWKIFFL